MNSKLSCVFHEFRCVAPREAPLLAPAPYKATKISRYIGARVIYPI